MELSHCCLLLFFLVFVQGGSSSRPNQDHDRERESGLPQAKFTTLRWSTERYSISRTEPSRINMHISANSRDDSDRIQGTGLWQVNIFGSQHSDGTGPRYYQNQNVLSPSQIRQPLYPNRELAFDVEFNFLMGQIGCDGINYICVEFTKGSNPNPDFEIPSPLGRNAIRECQERSCQFLEDGLKRALMTNIGFSAGSGSESAPRGLANMDITTTILTNGNSDRIQGRGLWRVGIYGSQSTSGAGRRLNEVRNILSDSVASKTLNPGRDLVLPANYNLNLQGIGTGQDYSYLCMEFAKGDAPEPNFDLPISDGSIISCSSIEGTPISSGNTLVMLKGFSSAYEIGREYTDGSVDLTIEAGITPHEDSDPVSGTNLWKLALFGSTTENAQGRRYPVSEQLLRPPHTNIPLRPNQDLEFRVTENVDIRAIGRGTSYPYLCLAFGKNQYANPDYDLELGGADTVITCHLMGERSDGMGTHGGGGGGHGTQGGGGIGTNGDRPRALISHFGYEIATMPVPGSHLTEVEIDATLRPFDGTDDIRGRGLWRLGIFGSSDPDGDGSRMGQVRQLLPANEQDNPLIEGSPLEVTGSASVDLRGIGGSEFPYLCVEFGKADNNDHFDFPVSRQTGTLLSCRLFEGRGQGGSNGGGDDTLRALFSRYRISINPSAIPDSYKTRLEIGATIIPHAETDYVPDGMFRLGLYGSDTPDGTGTRVNEVRQLLPRESQTHPVYAGRNVQLEVTSDVDLRGVGSGTNYPYICLEFDKKNDNVNFDMPMSTPTGTFVACNPFTRPDSTHGGLRALLRNMQNSLGFRPVPGTNMLEATIGAIITPHSDTDNIPMAPRNGANWRLGIYGSAAADGSGRRKREVPQILTSEQRRLPMYPNRPLEFESTIEIDFRGVGQGTEYPYLCIEFDKASDNVNFDLPQGSMVACNVFTAPAIYPEPEPERGHDAMVTVTEVVPDTGIRAKEKESVQITFDVDVNVDPSSDNIQGFNLWTLKVYACKKKNGRGPRIGEVPQALTTRQQSQPVHNGALMPFTDITTSLDLTGAKCKDAKYFCAEFLQGANRVFQLESSVIGCQKLKCQKKSKKPKPAATTLTVESVTPSRVYVYEDRQDTIDFTVSIDFDPANSQPLTRGSNLWKLTTWFNNEASGTKKFGLIEQTLTGNKVDKLVRDVSAPFGFGNIQVTADLQDIPCKKLTYFCVKLSTGNPTRAFVLNKAAANANMGCQRTTCR